jgi:superfamily II DNA or RNA helicase
MVLARSTDYWKTSSGDEIRLTYRLRSQSRGKPFCLEPINPDGEVLEEGAIKKLMPKLNALDTVIAQELRTSSIFTQITDAQVARLLPLLTQRRTLYDNKKIKLMDDEYLRPRILVEEGARHRLVVTLALADQDGDLYRLDAGRLLVATEAYFLVGHRAYPIASKAPWELSSWARQPTQDLSHALGPKGRDQLVATLAAAGVPPEDLEALAVGRGEPDAIIAKLHADDGKTMAVNLSLHAQYGDTTVTLESSNPGSAYVVAESNEIGLVERDLRSEQEARQAIRQLGFRFERERTLFVGRGELALEALDPSSDIFPPHWIIERQDGPAFRRDLSLEAEVELLESRGLLDLKIDINALSLENETVEALINMKSLLEWFQSGKRYLKLDDGSYVAPSAEFRQNVAILDDLGLDTQRVFVSPMCIGLLRLLGQGAAIKAANDYTQAWIHEVSGTNKPAITEVPEELRNTLRSYQQHGIDWLNMLQRYKLTGILADDMGLGKTLQALCLLQILKDTKGPQPALVVAPTSVVTVWRDEATRFTPRLKTCVLQGSPAERHAVNVQDYDLLIISYGVLRRDAERMRDIKFSYVIIDEAQAAKNAATQNAKAIRQLQSENRLALTGTPIENRPEELWAAFDFLAPGFLGNVRQFRKRYARPIGQGSQSALTLLKARIHPFIMRRLKSEVAKDLPPKIESTLRCEFDTAQRALYEHLAGQLRDSVIQKIEKVGIERSHLDVLAALTRLRQICCDPALLPAPEGTQVPPSAKLALFMEIMREALESNRSIIVFSQFVKMQRILIRELKAVGVEPLWLHGGTRNRDKVVQNFQNPDGPPVIVVSLKAGGTGLTLTRADTVIHYDPWWNPAVERQATDRAHRIGQTQKITVYKLICANTIEEKVLKLAESKEQLAEELLGREGQSSIKSITTQDIMALLASTR